MYVRYLHCCERRGLTLIEVIAAAALLATLLVGVLVAFTKNAQRIRTALAAREAVAAVDQLLHSWAQRGLGPPPQDEGHLPGVTGYVWHTRVVSREWRDSLGVDIVRLEVRTDRETRRSDPVLRVDLPVRAAPEPVPGGATP